MVISAERVEAAQKQERDFFSKHRKDTTLKVNWSLDTEKALSEYQGISSFDSLIDLAKEEMKNNPLLKEFEDNLEKDTEYYSSYYKDESDNDEPENLEFLCFH